LEQLIMGRFIKHAAYYASNDFMLNGYKFMIRIVDYFRQLT
jgi:hypothetical protein